MLVIGFTGLLKNIRLFKKVHGALFKKFCFGFYIELMGMPTLEYIISGYLNLVYGEIEPNSNRGLGPTPAMIVCYVFAVFFFSCVICAPVIIGIFY